MNEPWRHRKETVFTVATHSNCLKRLLNTKVFGQGSSDPLKVLRIKTVIQNMLLNIKFYIYLTGSSEIDAFG